MTLTAAQELKFTLLAEGLSIEPRALLHLRDVVPGGALTSADYASTSGLILELEDSVWVNAPIREHNPNFVATDTPQSLDVVGDRLVVRSRGREYPVRFWPQPAYHGSSNQYGLLNNYVVTHGDRARLSPLRGCAMTCLFCNIPYDDPLEVYATKPVDACLEALRTALADPVQPAHHVLVSGGTPKPKDVGHHRALYRAVLEALPDVDVDIMMAPLPGLLDLPELHSLGVHELSVNIEVFSRERARVLARNKFHQGINIYLDCIERASQILGPGRARSMLLVGLEPPDDTLRGVTAIAERGGTPVLSPFRPDPATPLCHLRPPSAAELSDIYLRATDVVQHYGIRLGPFCPPCSHNTLTLVEPGDRPYHRPVMV